MATTEYVSLNSTGDGDVTVTVRSSINNDIDNKAAEVVTVIYFVLGFAVCLLNGVVITLYFRFKRMRTVPNLLITNLATADFLMGFILISYGFTTQHESHGKAECLLQLCAMYTSGSASTVTLIVIAIDRYIAIIFPLGYDRIVSKTKAKVTLVGIWIYAMLLGHLPAMGWNEWKSGDYCHISNAIPTGYKILLTVAILGLAVVACLGLYLRIFFAIKQQQSRIRVLALQQQINASGATSITKKLRSVKPQLLIVSAFVIMWLPVTVAVYVGGGNTSQMRVTITACSVVGALNSLLNPIIYAARLQDYRYLLRRMVNKARLQLELIVRWLIARPQVSCGNCTCVSSRNRESSSTNSHNGCHSYSFCVNINQGEKLVQLTDLDKEHHRLPPNN